MLVDMDESQKFLSLHAVYDRQIRMIKQCLAITTEMETLLLDLRHRNTCLVAGHKPQNAAHIPLAH